MRSRVRSVFLLLGAIGLVAATTACGSDSRTDATGTPSGDITVFAAASLTAAFTDLADAFMAANPDTTVTLNFAASSELVTQIGEGAPADLFASADLSNMAKLTDAGNNAGEPVVLAHPDSAPARALAEVARRAAALLAAASELGHEAILSPARV